MADSFTPAHRKMHNELRTHTQSQTHVCMFYVYVMCMFCIVFKFELVKSPEVTLSG